MTDVDERECQLAELLTHFEKMKPARLNAIHSRIVKKLPRRPRTNCCTPQSKLIENWMPKNVAKTSKALLLILDGAGIKEAPFTVSDGWQFKLFTSEIAQRLVHGDGQVASQRSAMAQTALMVSSLAARVVERAREIQRAEPTVHGDALIAMQGSRDDPGWSKSTTRGSGVVTNERGMVLFKAALSDMSNRIALNAP